DRCTRTRSAHRGDSAGSRGRLGQNRAIQAGRVDSVSADASRVELGAAADAAGAADVPLEQQFALGLRQAAPNSVRLTDVQGVRTALGHHRAGAAHLLGPTFPLQTGTAALSVWMEEHRGIHAAAKAV